VSRVERAFAAGLPDGVGLCDWFECMVHVALPIRVDDVTMTFEESDDGTTWTPTAAPTKRYIRPIVHVEPRAQEDAP